jgi:GAF domain-containing protein
MLVAHRGLSEPFVSAISFIPYNSPQISLLQKRLPIFIRFSDLLGMLNREQAILQASEGIRALASIPLINGGELIGALNAASHTQEAFSETTKNAIEALAAQVSAVVARLRS